MFWSQEVNACVASEQVNTPSGFSLAHNMSDLEVAVNDDVPE